MLNLLMSRDFPGVLVVKKKKKKKKSACSARDEGYIPGSGRSSGEGNSNLLQYSWLENSMDRGVVQAIVYGVTKESEIT